MGGKGGQGHRHTVAAKQTSCVTLRHLTSDFHQVTMSGAPPAWRAEGTDLHTHWERSADVTLRGLPLTHRKPLFSGPHQQYNADGAWVLTIAFVSPDNTNPPGNPHLQGRATLSTNRAAPRSQDTHWFYPQGGWVLRPVLHKPGQLLQNSRSQEGFGCVKPPASGF